MWRFGKVNNQPILQCHSICYSSRYLLMLLIESDALSHSWIYETVGGPFGRWIFFWMLSHISVELIKLKTATKLAARRIATNIVYCQCPTRQNDLYFPVAILFYFSKPIANCHILNENKDIRQNYLTFTFILFKRLIIKINLWILCII